MTDNQAKERVALTVRVLKDLKLLGLSPHKLKYDLHFKNYSSCYFGKYVRPRNEDFLPKIFIYLYKDSNNTELYSYKDIISTVIHEVCHHIQWSNPDFVRVKGVMHNKEFWDLWNSYMNKYYELTNEEKGERYANSVKKGIRKGSHSTS